MFLFGPWPVKRKYPTPNKRSITSGPSRVARPVALPQINANQTVHTKLRFQVTTPGTYTVTQMSLAQACGGLAVGVSSYQAWASTVRLHRVTMYGIDTVIPVTLRLQWGNGGWVGLARDLLITDSSLGVTTPAVIDARPPVGSAAAMWMSYQAGRPNDTIFDFTVIGSTNTRAFIDVEVTFMLDSINPGMPQTPPLVPNVTSLTVGQPYWSSLVPNASSVNQIALPSFY